MLIKVLNSKIQGEESKLSELEELSEEAFIKKCDLDEQIHAQSRNISELSERVLFFDMTEYWGVWR